MGHVSIQYSGNLKTIYQYLTTRSIEINIGKYWLKHPYYDFPGIHWKTYLSYTHVANLMMDEFRHFK